MFHVIILSIIQYIRTKQTSSRKEKLPRVPWGINLEKNQNSKAELTFLWLLLLVSVKL